MRNAEKNLPLEGIKVLAFTHAVMGPAADCFYRSDGTEETEVHWKDAHIITTPSQGRSRYKTDQDIDQTAGRQGTYAKASNRNP